MPESACHWNAPACALSMRTARSFGRPRWRANRRRSSSGSAHSGSVLLGSDWRQNRCRSGVTPRLKQAGLAVELLETRHAIRAILTARKLIQAKLQDIENSLRGILRGFGLKVGKTTKRGFTTRISQLVAGHPALEAIAAATLAVHAALVREFNNFEKQVRVMSILDAKARLLMSTPAVGPIISLTYASAIDDPAHFTSSKRAGPLFGLTPKKHQSGETDYSGRISKNGDASLREALYEAPTSS